MQKVKEFFGKVWEYLKTRGVGFYLLIPAVILSFIIPFVYMSAYGSSDIYWSAVAFILPLLAVAAYAMSFFKYTAKYTGIVMFALLLAGLAMFVNTIYYDVVDRLFKAGFMDGAQINLTKTVGEKSVFVCVAYIINIVLCAVASFFNQFRTPVAAEEKVVNADAEVTASEETK